MKTLLDWLRQLRRARQETNIRRRMSQPGEGWPR